MSAPQKLDWSSCPLLLSTKQIAELTGLSCSFFEKARMKGAVKGQVKGPPFVKFGKNTSTVRYPKEEAQRWFNNLIKGGC